MPFSACYYHVIWATKGRATWLTPPIENVIFNAVDLKSQAMHCTLEAINGYVDHLHVAVQIPPSMAVHDWVKQVREISSREVNGQFPELEGHFAWQASYGVLTFGVKQLTFVIDYIVRQKEHHAQKTTWAYLENDGDA